MIAFLPRCPAALLARCLIACVTACGKCRVMVRRSRRLVNQEFGPLPFCLLACRTGCPFAESPSRRGTAPRDRGRRTLPLPAARTGCVNWPTALLPPPGTFASLSARPPFPVRDHRYRTDPSKKPRIINAVAQWRSLKWWPDGQVAGYCWRASRQPLTTYRVLTGCPVSARGLLFGGAETGR